MTKIFISYRRSDSEDIAGRIYDRLVSHFGKDAVSFDVDSIPLGVDFREHLSQLVGACCVFLAVVGDKWLSEKDAIGQRRLDDPRDFVRIEIASALKRGIPIIPLLVRGGTMPAEQDLPADLQDFAFRNATEIRAGRDFPNDMNYLIRAIDQQLPNSDPPHPSGPIPNESRSRSASVAPAPKTTPEAMRPPRDKAVFEKTPVDPKREQEIRRKFESKPFQQRVEALRMIGEHNLPALKDILEAALTDDNCSVREAAIEVVGELGLQEYSDQLKRIVRTDDWYGACRAAWQALDKFGLDIVEELRAALRRENVSLSLISYLKESAIKEIGARNLHQMTDLVRRQAREANSDKACRAAWQVLGQFDVDVAQDLRLALKSDQMYTCAMAIDEVGLRDQRQFADTLRRIARSNANYYVCERAWRVLDQFGVDVADDLHFALKAPSPQTRWAAVEIVDKLALTQFAEVLSALAVNDSEDRVRKQAVKAISNLDLSQHVNLLWRVANEDAKEDVRQTARQGLIGFGIDPDDS